MGTDLVLIVIGLVALCWFVKVERAYQAGRRVGRPASVLHTTPPADRPARAACGHVTWNADRSCDVCSDRDPW